jgi:hypothetical protein
VTSTLGTRTGVNVITTRRTRSLASSSASAVPAMGITIYGLPGTGASTNGPVDLSSTPTVIATTNIEASKLPGIGLARGELPPRRDLSASPC